MLDRIADEKLYKGYEKNKVTCDVCFVRKSNNGSCNC